MSLVVFKYIARVDWNEKKIIDSYFESIWIDPKEYPNIMELSDIEKMKRPDVNVRDYIIFKWKYEDKVINKFLKDLEKYLKDKYVDENNKILNKEEIKKIINEELKKVLTYINIYYDWLIEIWKAYLDEKKFFKPVE